MSISVERIASVRSNFRNRCDLLCAVSRNDSAHDKLIARGGVLPVRSQSVCSTRSIDMESLHLL